MAPGRSSSDENDVPIIGCLLSTLEQVVGHAARQTIFCPARAACQIESRLVDSRYVLKNSRLRFQIEDMLGVKPASRIIPSSLISKNETMRSGSK